MDFTTKQLVALKNIIMFAQDSLSEEDEPELNNLLTIIEKECSYVE